MLTFLFLQNFVNEVEEKRYTLNDQDKLESIYSAMSPMFIMLVFQIIEVIMCKQKRVFSKLIITVCTLILACGSYTYVDSNQHNEIKTYLMSVLFIIILMTITWVNFSFFYWTTDEKLVMFYGLDSIVLKFTIYGDIFGTVVYSICLFYWMYVVETNADDQQGY